MQLFSRGVAKAFNFYREKNPATKDAFKHTGHIEELTLLLNDAFDTMNGRRFVEGISSRNWVLKKKTLEDLLDTLKETETHSKLSKDNPKPFLSDTSLKAMRITVCSTIELVEFLLKKCGFDFVLTGKFNQDCLEVIHMTFSSLQ